MVLSGVNITMVLSGVNIATIVLNIQYKHGSIMAK